FHLRHHTYLFCHSYNHLPKGRETVIIMKVIVSLLLVIATIVTIWGVGSMIDFTVFMVCLLQ
ncbi:MAG: hypothetical protein WBG61_02980, partial [Desulfobacterales bacterium]